MDARIRKPVKKHFNQAPFNFIYKQNFYTKPVVTPFDRNRSINTSGPVPALCLTILGKIVQTGVNLSGLSSKKTLYKMTHFSNMPRYRKLLVTVAQDLILKFIWT